MTDTRKSAEERLREIGDRLEDEVRRAVAYVDGEIVPEVRRGSSNALRTLSNKLRHLAEHLDDERRRREDGTS